jgi:hypothetical protein
MTYVVAIHEIADPDRFWNAADPSQIPAGITLHATYPQSDGSRAVCLWEADSVEAVRNLVDGTVGDASRNDYFEADSRHAGALGLPS